MWVPKDYYRGADWCIGLWADRSGHAEQKENHEQRHDQRGETTCQK